MSPETRQTLQRRSDVALLVTRGDQDGGRGEGRPFRSFRPFRLRFATRSFAGQARLQAGGDDFEQGHAAQDGEVGEDEVEQPADQRNPDGEEDFLVLPDDVEVREREQVGDVLGVQPGEVRRTQFQPQPLGGQQGKLPENAEVRDHHPRLRRAHAAQALEGGLDVVEIADDVGEDHHVEAAVEVEFLHVGDVELVLRELRARLVDHAGTDVDAHALRGLERVEQFAGAAADQEDRGTLGHVELKIVLHQPVIVAVAAAAFHARRGGAVEKVDDGFFFRHPESGPTACSRRPARRCRTSARFRGRRRRGPCRTAPSS